MKPSASGVSGSNEVDLNENESYQRTQGFLTLQNEAYGVHMNDQGSIMSSPMKPTAFIHVTYTQLFHLQMKPMAFIHVTCGQ